MNDAEICQRCGLLPGKSRIDYIGAPPTRLILCDPCYASYHVWLNATTRLERQYYCVAHGNTIEYNDYLAGMRLFRRYQFFFNHRT